MKAGAKKAFVRTTGAVALGASSMSLAFPALAFASEEESGGISAILPNMTEFIPMLVCFIILVVVLGKLGWPKFAGMLEKRERTIKESLEKSEAARIESERLLEEYKRQLEEAKSQAAQIVADAKKTGEAVKADMTEKARAAIEAEKKAAISELQGSVADLSISVASRVIGNDLNDDEHRKIVERYVNEAGSFNAN